MTKFNEFVKVIKKYHNLEFFDKKILKSSSVIDIKNDIFRYPEGVGNPAIQLDLKEFGKITKKDIEELEKDIELISRRVFIPAEYKHLKEFSDRHFY